MNRNMSKTWTRRPGGMEGTGDEEALSSHGVHKKKHKKHKKHKKKHHHDPGGSYTESTPKSQHRHPDSTHKPQLKLKIKLGGQVLGTKSVPTFTVVPEVSQSPSPLMVVDDDEEPMEGVPIEQYRAWLDEDSNLDPLPSPVGAAEPEQDEETRWLDALERGELDVNGDLKRETDESLLTARQLSGWLRAGLGCVACAVAGRAAVRRSKMAAVEPAGRSRERSRGRAV
ncbi:INO80 complex subunit B [Rhinophrynus dorsalis]